MPLSTKASGRDSALGVDLGTAVVNVVATTQVADRVDVDAAMSFVLPVGCVERSVVADPGKVGRVLGQHLAANGIAPAPAVLSVPSSSAVLRWVTLPLLAGDELREAARFKVKRHLPFPVETAYVEAAIPTLVFGDDEASHGHDATAECLVIVVPRNIIDSRAEALEAAGLEAMSAELEAQAILRVVERKLQDQSPLWRDASLTIIDVGANNTHMYVVQNQRLQFLRGVRFGSAGFAHAVAKELEVSTAEAEALLGSPSTELSADGFLHMIVPDSAAGDEVGMGLPAMVNVQSEVDKLTREFLRLLRYFRSLRPERSYAGILDFALLCGGFAGMKGFAETLQTSLGLHVERARPFAGTVAKFNKDSFESISKRQEAYTVAMGLALSGLRLSRQQGSYKGGETRARREYIWSRAA